MNAKIDSRRNSRPKVTKVHVHWSESADFEDETDYSFSVFEELAAYVAQNHMDGGYLKTKVSVFFEDGFVYEQARIDLAPRDAHGFRDHMEQLARYAKTQYGREFHSVSDRMRGEPEGTSAEYYRTFLDRYELADA